MFNFIKRSLKCNFGIDKEYYRFIDKMFGFVPDNIELYKVALIHKSASQSVGGHHINNERLEYLGDAVIETVTSEYLFIEYPDRDEGFLTQMRSKMVSRQALNEMAVMIGLDKYIISNGAATSQQKHIYGDAFEAMVGAIYLDKGYDFVNRLLINDIFPRCISMEQLPYEENDFKSRLIEWCQKNHHKLTFETRKGFNRKGSAPTFYATAVIDGIEVGHGSGDSKKSAEQKAACSVSHELTDKECARLLDRFDWLMTYKNDEAAASVPPRKHGKVKSVHMEEAEEYVEFEDTDETPTTAPAAAEHPAPKKRRGGRRKKNGNNAAAPVAETAASVEEQPVDKVSEPAPAAEQTAPKKRRGGRKKAAESAPEAPVESAAAEPAPEAPKKPRRNTRKKTEATASAESAGPAAAEAVPEQAAPKKPRGGRRKKAAETTAPEVGSAEN